MGRPCPYDKPRSRSFRCAWVNLFSNREFDHLRLGKIFFQGANFNFPLGNFCFSGAFAGASLGMIGRFARMKFWTFA